MADIGANPIDIPELYDSFIIGGLATPGVCTVEKAARPFKWDIKEGKGSSGGTTTFQGGGVPKFTVKLKMWLPEHFESWEEIQGALRQSNASGKVTALDVLHPFLEQLDIFSVVVENVGQPERAKDGDTLYTVSFDMIEYHPPKKSGGTPGGSKPAAQVAGETFAKDYVNGLVDGLFGTAGAK